MNSQVDESPTYNLGNIGGNLERLEPFRSHRLQGPSVEGELRTSIPQTNYTCPLYPRVDRTWSSPLPYTLAIRGHHATGRIAFLQVLARVISIS
jgi:hypothetical protein